MSAQSPQPYELWKQADGDPQRYRQLLIEHGHLIQRPAPEDSELCATCTKPFSAHREEIMGHEFKRLPATLPCGWYPGKPL